MPGARPGTSYMYDYVDREAVDCGCGLAAASADRPSADALRVQHVLGDPNLLVAARAGRGARSTVGVPGARRELQTTGEAVTGADAPVATRLALRDGIPVHAVCPMSGRRRDVRARRRSVRSRRRRSVRSRRRRSVRSRRRRSVRSRRRRSVRSRRRRSVRSRRRRSVRSGAGGRRVWVEARRYLVRVSGGRRDGHERARDGGKNERLSDVLQICSFRGARAKASPRMWAEAVWLMPALKRAVLGQARQRRAKSARRVLPTDHGRAFAVRGAARTRVRGFNYLITVP